jgi:hypothetical protein
MTIEDRLTTLEARLRQLETENADLRKAQAAPQELSPLEIHRIKELARDTMRYGYDAAMAMHGRKTARQLAIEKRKRRSA